MKSKGIGKTCAANNVIKATRVFFSSFEFGCYHRGHHCSNITYICCLLNWGSHVGHSGGCGGVMGGGGAEGEKGHLSCWDSWEIGKRTLQFSHTRVISFSPFGGWCQTKFQCFLHFLSIFELHHEEAVWTVLKEGIYWWGSCYSEEAESDILPADSWCLCGAQVTASVLLIFLHLSLSLSSWCINWNILIKCVCVYTVFMDIV